MIDLQRYNVQICDLDSKLSKDNTYVTLIGIQPDFDSALLKVSSIIGEIKKKVIEIKFAPHETMFTSSIENMLSSFARKYRKVISSVFSVDKKSFLLVTVNLVAIEKDIAKCSAGINTFGNSLTSEEYLFPGTVPPLEKIEQDFNVKILADAKSHRIFGSKDAISAAKQHINVLLGNNNSKSL